MNLKFLAIVITTFLIFSNIVLAVPSPPNWFYGIVTINGSPAPDGATVTTKINGIDVASTTTVDGKYGYEPLFYVPDTDPSTRPGLTITFFVNGVNTGQTAFFANGDVDRLDLSVTISGGGDGGGGGGGGGSGGGGGIIPPTTGGEEEETEQGCVERWSCSDWGECVNGLQTRTCTDLNNCGTRNNEPFTSQPCTTVETEEEEITTTSPLGFFLLSPTDWLIGIVAGAVIAIIVIFLVRRRKK